MTRLTRRDVLQRGPIALGLAGSAGVTAARGRPELAVSSPDCGTIRLEYVRGSPPLTVYVDAPDHSVYRVVRLTKRDRTATLTDVPEGRYSVRAKPGGRFDDGDRTNSAVVLPRSAVTVEPCAQPVQVDYTCVASNIATVGITNPNEFPVTVDVTMYQGSLSNQVNAESYTVPAESDIAEPRQWFADGRFIHVWTATAADGSGTSVAVNGDDTYQLRLDCR